MQKLRIPFTLFLLASLLVFTVGVNVPLPDQPLTTDRLKHDVVTLAQPEWEGRKVGTEGNKKARHYLMKRFQQIGITPQYVNNSYEQAFKGGRAVNLVGYVKGWSPGLKCVFIGAHYDALGIQDEKVHPGADDNASGVALMLELAKRFKERAVELKQCLYFAAWDYEERGTIGGIKGSRFFVEHTDGIKLEDIQLSVTFDLVGGHLFKGLPDTVFAFGTESSPSLAHLVSSPQEKLQVLPFATEVLEPLGSWWPRSDYGPFRDHGVPHLFFSTGTPWYYHQPTDTAENIDYNQMAHITSYVFDLLWPILTEQVTIERSETHANLRQINAKQALGILKTLIENAKLNEVEEDDLEDLKEDVEKLSTVLTQENPEISACHVQIPFMDILTSLKVRGPSSFISFLLNRWCWW